MNVTSDIDLFVSIHQIKLLQQLVTQSTAVLYSSKSMGSDDKKDHFPLDSGIGSDISALRNGGHENLPGAATPQKPETKTPKKEVSIMEPFDVL